MLFPFLQNQKKHLVFIFYKNQDNYFDINMVLVLMFFCKYHRHQFTIHVFDAYQKYVDKNFAILYKINLYTTFSDDFTSICNKSEIIFCSFYQDILLFLDCLDNQRTKIINLWHGFPIRHIMARSSIEAQDSTKIVNHPKKKQVHHIVSSTFYKKVFAESFLAPKQNIHIFGNIRSDVILSRDASITSYLKQIAHDTIYNKIAIFCPTHSIKPGENIEPWDGYEFEEFDRFLQENKILLLVKIHDGGGVVYINTTKNIKVINSQELLQKGFFVQHLFHFVDIMITNASSVLTDFILLDRPIILIETPESYKKNANFISPEFLSVGAVVQNQGDIIKEISRILQGDEDPFKTQRQKVQNMVYDQTQNFNTLTMLYSFIQKPFLSYVWNFIYKFK
jgi:CDP-glycerol glycerophosphotransferase (TagB/SpsB family)